MARFRLLTASLLCCVLVACASQEVTSIPTAQRSGQTWIVTRTALAAQLLQACPGGIADDAQDLFAPDRSLIDRLEAHLPSLDAQSPGASQADRQYVGVQLSGKPYIFIRGLPVLDHRDRNPARESAADCSTGWESLYDPSTDQFIRFRTLGEHAGHN